MLSQKTAIVFGATGLIGSYLVALLCESDHYKQVISFSRKPSGFSDPKLSEHISDLGNLNDIASEITGNDLYCCLGTTIKKAGTKEKFKKIDFDMPVGLAKIAAQNKIRNFTVVSSIGADAKSSSFYLCTKGQMEQGVMQCDIPKISIVRPSMLTGPRKEFRFGEAVGKVAMTIFNPLMIGKFRKYRSIHAENVASAMIAISENYPEGVRIYESDELQQIAKSY